MASFMELIYVGKDGNGYQTNLRTALASDAQTWVTFKSFRRFGVDIKKATFLLDYHNRKGDLADTIAIDNAGFTAITGQQPKSDAEYQKIDADFWKAARRAA